MMKKFTFLLIVLLGSINSINALNVFDGFTEFCINDSLLDKKECWDITEKWIVTDMDKRNASVAYENSETGNIIIKGRFRDDDISLWSIREGFINIYVNYELEINITDSTYCASYNKIEFEPIVGYGNPYNLSKYVLQIVINEMKEIESLMTHKGDIFRIDSDFCKIGEDLDKQISEAKNKQEDKNISKKERKLYKKFYEDNHGRERVYRGLENSAHRLVFGTLLLDNNLEYKIKNTISAK